MEKARGTLKQKIAVASILLSLIAGIAPGGLAAGVVSAPLSDQPDVLNGMVRVYLSSLGNPTSLTLTSVGNYSVNGNIGQSLDGGQSCTVGFSAATGALTLTRNGVKTNMGTNFSLRRHSAAGESGIKIAQGRVPGNPYPGDISFQSIRQSNGAYKLYTIAHIYLENYLYGVLPYEMGNGSHMEALKAQAVAARTYTLNMMKSRATGIYDLVDTTNDQVYNGTPSGNANCVAAINATRGIVVMNGASYTSTYYSASNGGQTEAIANAWGTAGYGYLGVKDDPFDLANPDSVVKRATVYASCTEGGTNVVLLALLKTKAIAALINQGYSASAVNTEMQTIKDIQLHTPKYPAPSRLYTKLDATLAVSTKNRAGSTVNATVTVTCDIFTELESMLGMSIQTSSNELWTVRKSNGNFLLEARRFGHGIGLSQRGAMYMGKLGYTYDQILGFYYGGCKRVRFSFTSTILRSNSSQMQTTVEQPAEFTESTAGCTGVVKLVGSASSLAIRDQKSLTGNILGVIANNSPVSVYANDGAWCFVHFGNIRGYVPANALSLSGAAPAATEESVTRIDGFATVTANGYLNLRASGNFTANIITTAPMGAVLTVFARSNGWAHIQFGATVAYASMDFLTFSVAYPGSFASSGSVTAVITLEGNSGSANMRSAPSTASSVLAQLPHGTTVTVTRNDGSWCTVVHNRMTGYVASSCLLFENENLDGGAQQAQAPGNTGMIATVKAIIGDIREMNSENSPSLTAVAMGQSVMILEKGELWCKVRYEGVSGYMLTASLAFQEDMSGVGVKAVVATQSGSLNLRSAASAGSVIMTTIPRGAEVVVSSKGETWSAVRYHGISGYVMTCYLQFEGDLGGDSGPPATAGDGTARVITPSGSLNLRAEARAGSAILRTVPRLAVITVHQRGVEWCHVTYEGTRGYVMRVFLAFEGETVPDEAPSPGTTDPPEGEEPDGPLLPVDPDAGAALYGVVTTASGSLNLRQDALPGSPILARIPRGAAIRITQKLSAWSQTTYAGRQGYVMNAYLTFLTGQGVSGAAPESSAAWVSTSGGTLNLRAEPSSQARIIATIPNTTAVEVLAKGDSWCQVRYAGLTGFVMSQFLRFPQGQEAGGSYEVAANGGTAGVGNSPGDNQQPEAVAWVHTPSGGLNLRETGSDTARIMAVIPRFAQVAVLQSGTVWSKVRYNHLIGFVKSSYLVDAEPGGSPGSGGGGGETAGGTVDPGVQPTAQPTATAQPTVEPPAEAVKIMDPTLKAVDGATNAWVRPGEGQLTLGLWPECAEQGKPEGDMLPGAQVTVLMVGDTWCQVKFFDMTGYCLKKHLSFEAP